MTTHALYRFYDDTNELLYVGITLNPGNRWPQHAADKPWWQQVSRITIETLPDRDSVLQAERRAIQDEQPRFNVVHNRATTPRPAVSGKTAAQPVRHLFRVGEVVAVGVDPHATAPVGMVSAVDETGFDLDLYSWLSGFFGYGTKRIRWGQVKSFVRARPFTSTEAEDFGYNGDQLVWNMDPLADFQNDWKHS